MRKGPVNKVGSLRGVTLPLVATVCKSEPSDVPIIFSPDWINGKIINAANHSSASCHLHGTDGVCEDVQPQKLRLQQSGAFLRRFWETSNQVQQERKCLLTGAQSNVELWPSSNSETFRRLVRENDCKYLCNWEKRGR